MMIHWLSWIVIKGVLNWINKRSFKRCDRYRKICLEIMNKALMIFRYKISKNLFSKFNILLLIKFYT